MKIIIVVKDYMNIIKCSACNGECMSDTSHDVLKQNRKFEKICLK